MLLRCFKTKLKTNTPKPSEINKFLDDNMSMSLGSGLVKLIDITNAYGIIANGGKKIQPNFIQSIYDRRGKLVFKSSKKRLGAIA